MGVDKMGVDKTRVDKMGTYLQVYFTRTIAFFKAVADYFHHFIMSTVGRVLSGGEGKLPPKKFCKECNTSCNFTSRIASKIMEELKSQIFGGMLPDPLNITLDTASPM